MPVVYLNGTLLFVAGLSIVRVHNRWEAGWPVLVTLVGWGAMVTGLWRMLAPSLAHDTGVVGKLSIILALVTGIVLTVKGYGPKARTGT